MPTITAQPATTGFHSAYGAALTYQVEQSFTSGDPHPSLEVRTYIAGTLFSTKYRTPDIISGTTATFTVDISGIVQEWFRSNYTLPGNVNGNLNAAFGSGMPLVNCHFFAWEANADGNLEFNGSPATSNQCRVINSIDTPLSAYYASIGRKFLTAKPDKVLSQSTVGEFLSIYLTGTAELEIKCYDSSGTLQATRRKTIGGSGTRVVVLGVGVPNLIAMGGTGWTSETTIGGDFLDGGSSKKYTVQVLEPSPGAAISEVRTYFIVDKPDCIYYKLYFLNRLGFYDLAVVGDGEFEGFSTVGGVFESPITEVASNGTYRSSVETSKSFVAYFTDTNEADAVWLEELASTVDCREGTTLVPCILEDVSQETRDTFAPYVEIALRIDRAKKVYSQRN